MPCGVECFWDALRRQEFLLYVAVVDNDGTVVLESFLDAGCVSGAPLS